MMSLLELNEARRTADSLSRRGGAKPIESVTWSGETIKALGNKHVNARPYPCSALLKLQFGANKARDRVSPAIWGTVGRKTGARENRIPRILSWFGLV